MVKPNVFLTGLAAGVVAGAIISVLVTPKPGRDVRGMVAGRTAGVTGRARSYADNVKNRITRLRVAREPVEGVAYSYSGNGTED